MPAEIEGDQPPDPTNEPNGSILPAKGGMKQWRANRAKIQEYSRTAHFRLANIQMCLQEYRLVIAGLRYKDVQTDERIWDLYDCILASLPRLKQETRRLPLVLRTNRQLAALEESWVSLLEMEDALTAALEKAPDALEEYNKQQIEKQKLELDHLKISENERKLESTRRSLDDTLEELEEKTADIDAVSIGSISLSYHELIASWTDRLTRLDPRQHPVTDDTEMVVSMLKLESLIRGSPLSLRWIRSTEADYSELLGNHDLLVSLGKKLIPDDEIARTSLLMYQTAPELWTSGEHEALGNTLQIVESFIGKYQDAVLGELDRFDHEGYSIRTDRQSAHPDLDALAGATQLAHSLVSAIDSRDRFMRGHSELVTELAISIARRMNWGAADLDALELAALLHDVGKLAIPESILIKVQPLTEGDRKIIEKHPTYGASLLQPIEALNHIVPWVYFHQEKWDGSGYPEHLTRREIPVGASIITLAEAYIVMRTDLPYQAANSQTEALERIQDGAESQFNPEVVEAFLEEMESSPAPALEENNIQTDRQELIVMEVKPDSPETVIYTEIRASAPNNEESHSIEQIFTEVSLAPEPTSQPEDNLLAGEVDGDL